MRNLCAVALLLASVGFAGAQQRPRITGIAQVAFYTGAPKDSDAFYSRTLGFERVPAGEAVVYPVNALQSIEILPLPSPAPASREVSVTFRTTDAAALEHYLRGRGVTITQPLARHIFGVHDPEGNLIFFTDAAPDATHLSSHAAAHRIIHAGFEVKSVDAENAFYRDTLGFHLNWKGGRTESGPADWVSMQVPDGSDWLEYMLNDPANASAGQRGSSNHFSLGVARMDDAIAVLASNHCSGPNCTAQKPGRDGKIQLNLFDPDLTRAELMEFEPRQTPCCSPILGQAPREKEDQ